jgi:hypothetical protein
MIYFDKNLENIALKTVKEKWDEIKTEKDLQEIFRVINGIKSNINISLYIKEGIDLKERLRREYLEIRQIYEIISNIPSNSTGNVQAKNSIENQIMEELKIDYFGILASVLKKHDKIKDIKEFITGIF